MTTAPLIKRILVPHDFSDTAQCALDYALAFAEKFGAAITVVHSYEYPVLSFPEGPVITADLIRQIQDAAGAALDGVVSRAKRPGIAIDSVLRQGPVWSEILAEARDARADLIVIGTHGRRGLSRALLGSVAEKVVRTAPCPVLTVHGPASER
ncbi:MAG: universal stress protein [Polyangiaceae bacterium]|jgi:nucleotide-binding universal stress UspA family protein